MGGLRRRLFVYGCLGWVLEVGFTGFSSLLDRDLSASSRTYLWMFPIYGLGGLALERLGEWLERRGARRAFRALAYVPFIYAIELASGWLLCRALGRCPWDYGTKGLNFLGLIRWDFAPFWYAFSWAFDVLWITLTRPETRDRFGNQTVRSALLGSEVKSASRVQAGSFGPQPE